MVKMNEEIDKRLETLFEKLKDFFTSRTIIGKEIQVGDTTLIPVIEVSFGMGAGSGGGVEEKKPQGSGEGMGLGAKAKPSAVIVIKGDQVQLLPLGRPGTLEKLMEKVPEIVDKISKAEERKGKTEK
jgi:uncharacterized spore protein YtfJ